MAVGSILPEPELRFLTGLAACGGALCVPCFGRGAFLLSRFMVFPWADFGAEARKQIDFRGVCMKAGKRPGLQDRLGVFWHN